jgi:hypothetical protein
MRQDVNSARTVPLDPSWAPPLIDTSKAHPARMYDYYLGGKTNFPADREAAQQAIRSFSGMQSTARENRDFLRRAVHYLAAEHGVRQFLDIGTGIPTAPNTYQVAQAVAPEARVVYVDNDPIVLAHARALMTSDPLGRTAYIAGDLREPEKIIEHDTARAVFDWDQPIALLMLAVLHFVEDVELPSPQQIVRTLVDALPAGSFVVASHLTGDFDRAGVDGVVKAYRSRGLPCQARDLDEFTDLAFDGLTLCSPGVVQLPDWRPVRPDQVLPPPVEICGWCGVAKVG